MRQPDDIGDFDIEKWDNLLEEDWNSFLDFKRQEMEKLEKRYSYEWNIWIRRFEPEWMDFKGYMVNKKRIWIQKKEYEWNNWVKIMEQKWRDEILKTHRNDPPNDNRNECCDNIHVKNIMMNDLKRWIVISESNLYRWILRDWNGWKKRRIEDWTKSEWKIKENKYWIEWGKKTPTKDYLYGIKLAKYMKWKERLNRERKHWIELTDKIENRYIIQNHMDWQKWKKDKIIWFKEWMLYFIDDCITYKSMS